MDDSEHKTKEKKSRSVFFNSCVFFLILVLLNVIVQPFRLRLDLTKNKLYTLSDYSKNVLSHLDDILTIEVYISEKLPPNILSLHRQVMDLLKEYEVYSSGKLQIKLYRSDSSVEEQMKLSAAGIPKIQMNVIEKDQLQTINAHSGILLLYDAKKEVIPIVLGMDTLEYDLTFAITKLIRKTVPKIGIWVGDKEKFLKENNEIKHALDKQYEVVIHNYNESKLFENDLSVLIVYSPEGLTEDKRFFIDQFIMKGGRLICLIDRVKVDQTLTSKLLETGMEDQLNFYGVKTHSNVILDRLFSFATFFNGHIRYTVPYPLWPKLVQDNFDKDAPMFKGLESIVFPWAGSLSISSDKPDNIEAKILARSSKNSWEMRSDFNFNPQQKFSANSYQSFPMFISLEGRFDSYFKDKEAYYLKEGFLPSAKKDAVILLTGSSWFISDDMTYQFPNNEVFFLNMIDSVVLDKDVFGIPDRINFDFPIKVLSDKHRIMIKWLVTLSSSIFVILYGLFRYLSFKVDLVRRD